MEPTEGFETSAALKLTPGKHRKEDIQHSKPDESLKSRQCSFTFNKEELNGTTEYLNVMHGVSHKTMSL
jgi:hypothetical protein